MRKNLAVLLPSLVFVAGCTVDVSKLRGTYKPDGAIDGAMDAVADRYPGEPPGPKLGPDAAAVVVDSPGGLADVPNPAGDELDEVRELDDAIPDGPQPSPDLDWTTSDLEPALPDVTAAVPDLEQSSPDEMVVSPDLALPSSDAPEDSLDLAWPAMDLAPPDGDVAPLDTPSDPSVFPDTSDVPGTLDLGVPLDARRDSRPNGVSCSNADQCVSGFCVGSPGMCCNQSCNSVCYRANTCTTGTCAPATGTIACSDTDAFCGLVVNDPSNASQWSFQTDMQVGDLATGSDTHTLSAIPTELVGTPWIRPSRLSKGVTTNPLVTFNISRPADVYVGIDTRLSAPSWMVDWTDSGLTISYLVNSTSEPPSTVTQKLLTKRFAGGAVSLGPLACTVSANCSMYLTVIRFADQSGQPTCQ